LPLTQISKSRSFGFHNNPYCEYIKSNLAAGTHCVEVSHIDLYNRIVNAPDISAPFWGVCYCGVKEYVVPIVSNNTVIAAIVAGVFPCEADRIQSSFDRIIRKYDFDKARLETLYNESFSVNPPMHDAVLSMLHLCAEHLGAYCADQAGPAKR
jgi:ligand-binding sensor protein